MPLSSVAYVDTENVLPAADATPGRYRLWFSVGDSIGNRAAQYDVTLIEFVIE
jgi:hypothetical protein